MKHLEAVALMGATGTGKSALAMRIVKRTGSMIISCDSMQVYRGLDIGTAKPTKDERLLNPHALIDVCDLPDVYSAARWAAEARTVIRKANARGIRPLIVGGTGLYLKALLSGLADIPAEQSSIRQHYQQLLQREGVEALREELWRYDPETAARLEASDSQRIMRALCVTRSTGRPFSFWLRQPAQADEAIHCPVFVLEMERRELRRRLADRFSAMIDAGWLEEVRWLASLGLPETHPAMRAVGYRQLLAHVRGEHPLPACIEAGITATRRYAKRQQTWFAHQTPEAVHGDADRLASLIENRMNA